MNYNDEIELLLQGDRKAQHRVYDRLAPQMLSICYRYVNNKMDAESIVLEGFLRIFTTIDQLKSKSSFEAWARRIVVREALQFVRKKKTFDSIEEFTNEFLEDETEETIDVTQEAIFGLICELPLKCRTVFNLFVLDGYSHKQIAEELGITIATSKSHVKWARKSLKEKLGSISTIVNYG